MKEFLLIFRHGDGKAILSPEEMQQVMEMHNNWIESIRAKGQLGKLGTPLTFDESKVVWANKVVTDGPFLESKEAVGGFMSVLANSAEEAAEIAKGSPVLLGPDNSVEIRKIAQLS